MSLNLTEVIFILDRSGSMSGLESDTIGGFNGMISKMKKQEGDALVSTVLFSDRSKVIHDRIDIQNVPELTEKEYSVGGCTALLDAIGNSIHHISNIYKYARKEDTPEHTLFVITTDGMENASREYSYQAIKDMIEAKKKESNWEFLFLGANIDAIQTARRFGIEEDRAVNYNNDDEGLDVLYEGVSDTVGNLRANGSISAHWKDNIDADYQSRRQRSRRKGGR